MKIKLTNDLLDQLTFEQRPIGVDAKGRLITVPNVGKADDTGKTCPPEAYIIRDTETKGFGVRVSPNSISFFVQRKMGGSSSPKRTLGSYRSSLKSVSDARAKAHIWYGLMTNGQDPLVEIAQQQEQSRNELAKLRHTFGKAYESYMASKKLEGSPATDKDREQVKKAVEDSPSKIWGTSIHKITKDLVEKTLRPWFEKDPKTGLYGSKIATGWKVYRYCRAAYALATGRPGDDPTNPFSQWRAEHDLPEVPKRTQYLRTNKPTGIQWLQKLLSLRDDPDHTINVVADYLLCVLLWGGRKKETQLLRWTEVNFDDRIVTFRRENTKSKSEHAFPMTPFVEQLLRARKDKNDTPRWAQKNTKHVSLGEWVFASRVRGKHIVDIRNVLELCEAASGMKIRAHDLRRTFATHLAGKTDLGTVKLAMNHADAKRDVTWGYVQEKIEVLRPLYEARENQLLQLAGLATPSKVITQVEHPIPDKQTLRAMFKNPEVRKAYRRALLEAEDD